MEALDTAVRGARPSPPLPARGRADAAALAVASRPTGADPVLQRRAVEPIFRRPSVEPARRRAETEPAPGQPAAPSGEAQARPAEPPFEWLDLEIIPYGQKPDPRGYAVYSRKPRPAPVPVILIDAA